MRIVVLVALGPAGEDREERVLVRVDLVLGQRVPGYRVRLPVAYITASNIRRSWSKNVIFCRLTKVTQRSFGEKLMELKKF